MGGWREFLFHCDHCEEKRGPDLCRFTSLTKPNEPVICPECNTLGARVLPCSGGYGMIGNNGASQRPAGAGAFRGRVK